MGLERYDEARDYLRKYAALNPGEANPIDSLAELEFRAGRLEGRSLITAGSSSWTPSSAVT